MLARIIEYTLNQKALIIIASLFIISLGIYSYVTLPIDAFPDVTNIQVEIVSHANTLSAEEIERKVTYPIEMAMRGLPDIKQIRSVTKFGLSIVTIIFKDGVDIYFARQLVFERLAEARENVPAGVEVALGPVATVMGEIYQYTLEGTFPTDSLGRVSFLSELRTIQEWVVTPLLKNIQGVNEINSFGGYFKQYQVLLKPEQLLTYSLSPEEVFSALENNNQNVGGSIIERNSFQYIVRGLGLIKEIRDIENIVLKQNNGTPVYLKQVAEIKEGQAVRMGVAMKDGKYEAVGGIVMMLRGENSKAVVSRVKEKVHEINENNILPAGIKIVPYYDRTEIVNASVQTVNKALIEGAILVLIILYILLRSFRGSFVVLIALPLSLLATFIVMRFAGLSANLMSLGGLAISIGMIIDATIIQVENVQRHLGEAPKEETKIRTVLKAVLEVRKPSIFGELIIAITFIPILSLEGIEGKMFGPLAQTVAVAVMASMLLSIFVIPVLCYMFLKPAKEKPNPVMQFAGSIYIKMLDWTIDKKGVLLSMAAILLLVSIFLISRLGTEFIPVMDEGAFDADVALLPGVSLDKAIEINQLVSKKLKAFSELDVLVSRTGQTGVSLDTRGADKTGYVGILKPSDEWRENLSREELTEEMRKSLETIPGIAFGFSQPIQCRIDELVAGTRAQLIIKLFGDDLNLLLSHAEKIARILSSINGATDVMSEKIAGQPYINISIDREKIARYGINMSDVQNIIGIAVAGKTATKFYEGNRNFDITVRFQEDKRNSIEALEKILVPVSKGLNVPLAQVAQISMIQGPLQISRQDGMRRIGVELNITGRDIGGFVAEAKQKIAQEITLPPGYFLTWGGQFENQERAMNRLLLIGPLVIAVILVLLFITFNSIKLALLVIANLPFALIGGVFSLYISGMYLSVPASVGFIVLFGVAVLNGVVLVARISQLREEGVPLSQAIRMGSISRLRPVLMTASIAVFSLIPMLFASGAGSEIQKPLATVVVGGLITSTILTLLVIPAVYSWFDKGEKV
ncbi:MAG: cation transporter [Ignavibacteriales bacterium]